MKNLASHRVTTLGLIALIALSSSFVLADTSSSGDTTTAPINTEYLAKPVPYVEAPVFGPFTLHAGIKSTNTGERLGDAQLPNGRTYELQNEDYVSIVHKSGWGLSAMYVTDGDSYNKTGTNYGPGDASLTLLHPAWYTGRDLTLTGQFRMYYPSSNWSASHEIHEFAYYVFANYNMAKGLNFWNQLTPRYFAQPTYGASDTTYFAEDYSALTQRVNSWLRYGIGQHSQQEWHYRTAAGTSIEAYPLLDFFITANVFIEPRLKIPLVEENSVYDAPRNASLQQMYGEVYVQIAI